MTNNHWHYLMHVDSWRDHQLLDAKTLLNHEAQHFALLQSFAQVRWGPGNYGLLQRGKFRLVSNQDNIISWQCDPITGITKTGQLLVLDQAEGTTSINPHGHIYLLLSNLDHAPHPFWHQGRIIAETETTAASLMDTGQAFPVLCLIDGKPDAQYLPPAMQLNAYSELWQLALTITNKIEELIAIQDAPHTQLVTVWYPAWSLNTLAMLPPQLWILEQVRAIKKLAYSAAASNDTRTKLLALLDSIIEPRLDIQPQLQIINAGWELITLELTKPKHVVILDLPPPADVPTLYDEARRPYHPLPTIAVENATDGGRKPCLFTQLPAELSGRTIWLVIDQDHNPGELRFTLTAPGRSLFGVANTVKTFQRLTDPNNNHNYWVAEIVNATTLHNGTYLTILRSSIRINSITLWAGA